MRRFLLVAPLLAALGCQSTPGFTWRVEVTKPPVLSTYAPVSPVEAPPVAYAVEEVQNWPRYSRQPLRAPARAPVFADPCPPCPEPEAAPRAPRAEQLPNMPKRLPEGPARAPGGCHD